MCYYPMQSIENGTTVKGKKRLTFIMGQDSNSPHHITINGKRYWKDKDNYIPELNKKITMLKCGQCIQCRLEKSKETAIRAIHELETRENAIGLTLTYEDEYLPLKNWYNENGELTRQVPTLNEEDPRNFNKRLEEIYRRGYYRYKDTKEKILLDKKDLTKFYAGEYGDETERPHYHQIWYNLVIPDLEFLGLSKKGNILYTSKMINEIWGMGYVVINEVEYEYMCYVARYTVKKQVGKNKETWYNEIKGYEPEFARFPKRPGLGKDWYELHKNEIYKNDEIFVGTRKGGIKLKPPKYYDNKYEVEYPELMEMIKKRREEQAENQRILQQQTNSYERQQYREIKERIQLDKIKILTRDEI